MLSRNIGTREWSKFIAGGTSAREMGAPCKLGLYLRVHPGSAGVGRPQFRRYSHPGVMKPGVPHQVRDEIHEGLPNHRNRNSKAFQEHIRTAPFSSIRCGVASVELFRVRGRGGLETVQSSRPRPWSALRARACYHSCADYSIISTTYVSELDKKNNDYCIPISSVALCFK